MKFRSLIYAVLLAALPMFASATNNPPPKPTPKPPAHKPHTTTNTNSNTSKSESAAAAAAAAAAKANAGAEVNSDIGIDNQQRSELLNQSPSSSSLTDSSSVNARAWSLFVPPPVFTPPMPRPDLPLGCPAPTETQSALSVGSGVIFSKADSLRDNSPCTAIKYSQLLWDRCQYQKADRVLAIGMKLFAKSAGDDWDTQPDKQLTDYTLEECGVLKHNMVRPSAPLVNYVAETPPPACEAPKTTKAKGVAGGARKKVVCK